MSPTPTAAAPAPSLAASRLCAHCRLSRAKIQRPKTSERLCVACFLSAFEREIHATIVSTRLFARGARVAIGASGGKDSTVLAAVLRTLNERHDYGVEFVLLSIDEGIRGYRDDSLETVKRNAAQYGMPLCVLGYRELYGWTMDEVVRQIGKKGNCTVCGVFRRQALDRGAARLGVDHVVTGHNADDMAETVLMNLLRGDLPRLHRCTGIITESASSPIRRSKPLKYAYEKEIVLYAHHRKLDYFSTECIYSPEAFRGSARALIKSLERVRPSAILDIVRSGEAFADMVPVEIRGGPATGGGGGKGGGNRSGEKKRNGGKCGSGENGRCGDGCANGSNRKAAVAEPEVVEEEVEEEAGGCGKGTGGATNTPGGEMAAFEQHLAASEKAQSSGLETEITSATILPARTGSNAPPHPPSLNPPSPNALPPTPTPTPPPPPTKPTTATTRRGKAQRDGKAMNSGGGGKPTRPQQLQNCRRCGYMSSQALCKACVILDDLNKNRPRLEVEVVLDEEEELESASVRRRMEMLEMTGVAAAGAGAGARGGGGS